MPPVVQGLNEHTIFDLGHIKNGLQVVLIVKNPSANAGNIRDTC